MQVTIKDVEVEYVNKGRTKYGKAVVSYLFKGEARSQKIMSFANPEVFKKVQELVGQTVEVELTKNDQGYTEWKSITAAGANNNSAANTTAAPGGTTRVSGSNYETKEERAARQVLIVKQSSLSSAVETLSVGAKSAPAADDVLALAQKYTDWVFAKDDEPEDKSGFDNMDNDLPF